MAAGGNGTARSLKFDTQLTKLKLALRVALKKPIWKSGNLEI